MREPLYVLVGGNFGSVSVGEYKGKPILVTESISQEVDEGVLTVEGSVKRFGMEHGQVRLQESAVYTEVSDISANAPVDPVIYSKSHATIAGKYCSYEDSMPLKLLGLIYIICYCSCLEFIMFQILFVTFLCMKTLLFLEL